MKRLSIVLLLSLACWSYGSSIGSCSPIVLTEEEYSELVTTLTQVKSTLQTQQEALNQASMDSTTLQAQLTESLAALSQAQAQLETLKAQLDTSKTQLTQADNSLKLANQELTDASQSLKQQEKEANDLRNKVKWLRVALVLTGAVIVKDHI